MQIICNTYSGEDKKLAVNGVSYYYDAAFIPRMKVLQEESSNAKRQH